MKKILNVIPQQDRGLAVEINIPYNSISKINGDIVVALDKSCHLLLYFPKSNWSGWINWRNRECKIKVKKSKSFEDNSIVNTKQLGILRFFSSPE